MAPLNLLFSTLLFAIQPQLDHSNEQGIIDSQLNRRFLNAFQEVKEIPFLREDCDPNYLAFHLDAEAEAQLNLGHTYVMLEDLQLEALTPILESLKEPVTECMGTAWRVANVRAWKVQSGAEEAESSPLLKLFYYPQETQGTWLLSWGKAPQIDAPIAIEITLLPSLSYDMKPVCAGLNANHPTLPCQKPYKTQHPLYKKGEVIGVNVGGGPNWSCEKWLNLEEVTSSVNPYPFYLFPNCRFPFQNDSIQSVYTSHAIEHLNLPTVYRVFSEAHRVLEKGGNLIIKIPDYDKALDCWRRQDSSFFGPEWGIQGVAHRWAIRGTYDCLDYRASMIFCSFFNEAYGNPFGGMPCPNPAQAYFGPAAVSIPFLRELIQNHSVSEIAKELRKIIGSTETNFRYCHQSAWSREELKEILNTFGFEIFSFDPDLIIHVFGPIPGMGEMKTMSTFCWAKKK